MTQKHIGKSRKSSAYKSIEITPFRRDLGMKIWYKQARMQIRNRLRATPLIGFDQVDFSTFPIPSYEFAYKMDIRPRRFDTIETLIRYLGTFYGPLLE